jgi:hypothetical protein
MGERKMIPRSRMKRQNTEYKNAFIIASPVMMKADWFLYFRSRRKKRSRW